MSKKKRKPPVRSSTDPIIKKGKRRRVTPGRPYTMDEIVALRISSFSELPELAEKWGRTLEAVKKKKYQLTRPDKYKEQKLDHIKRCNEKALRRGNHKNERWAKWEEQMLLGNRGGRSVSEIAIELGRSYESVQIKMHRLRKEHEWRLQKLKEEKPWRF